MPEWSLKDTAEDHSLKKKKKKFDYFSDVKHTHEQIKCCMVVLFTYILSIVNHPDQR